MGFKFKTEVKDSIYGGKGLFALEFIPTNRIITSFCDQQDDFPVKGQAADVESNKITLFSKDQFEKIEAENPSLIPNFLKYGYYHQKSQIFVYDESPRQFGNHSNSPCYAHILGQTPQKDVYLSLRDIEPGQELLEKYWGQKEYKKIAWLYNLFQKYEQQRIHVMQLADKGNE